MRSPHTWQKNKGTAPEEGARAWCTACPGLLLPRWHPAWLIVAWALLAAGEWWPGQASDPQPAFPLPVQRPLEMQDWPALLNGLAGDPLTNTILRHVVVRALFETGRLPEELFSWFHSPGPELLSTSELKQHAGSGHIAETLLQLGHLNAGERLAFDSLETEGETAPVLRTLVRIHVTRDLPEAAGIFLNRLQAFPDQGAWAAQLRAGLANHSPAAADPTLARIRANLITKDRIAAGLTTELLLRQALEANPENRMALQYLVAQQLLARRLLNVRQTLATSPQTREGPWPRHYAEALLLHRQLYPGISLGSQLARVPPAVAADFRGFQEILARAQDSLEQVQPQAWRDFGNTYWYYHFFGSLHPPDNPVHPAKP